MRFRKLGFLLILSALLTILLTAATVFGGTVGKIQGAVTDEKGEAIPGASVRIENTSMGAAANFDGSYVILNVPPGTYTLSAQTVGFNKMVVEKVIVQADVTTEQKFKLTSSAIEQKTITVVAEKKTIDKYISTNQSKMTGDQLKSMPVSNVNDVLKTMTGFVKQGGVFHARGGRGNEISYIIDGIEIKDPQGSYGANYKQNVDVAASDVEELSVLKGNYDAENGGANSAIINIVRKEGNIHSTSGRLEYRTDDLGFGNLNKYSFNSDRLEWNLSGPVPAISDQLFPAVGLKWPGEKMAYFMSFSVDKSNSYLDYNNYPSASSKIDYGYEKFMGIKIPNRRTNQYSGSGKLTWKMDQNAKYRLSINYWKQWQKFTGFSWAFLYTPSTAPKIFESKEIYGATFTFSPSFLKNTFGELKVNRFIQKYEQDPGSRKPGDFLNADNYEGYVDKNQNGKWDKGEPFVDGNHDGFFGEPFHDYNGDGVYNPADGDTWTPYDTISSGVSGQPDTMWVDDLNHNGKYDSDIGEPYSDLNGNGKWDPSEQLSNDRYFFDYNHNGIFDHAGDEFVDVNGNGIYDDWEPYQDTNGNGKWDAPEPYIDANGNGQWDVGETYTDTNGNGHYDAGETYTDVNHNGRWDINWTDTIKNGHYDPGDFAYLADAEPFEDSNNNHVWDAAEPYADLNGNGHYDLGEPFTDVNQNGVWDGAEPYTDANSNGSYDNLPHGDNQFDIQLRDVINTDVAEPYIDGDIIIGEPFIDVDGDGVFHGYPNDTNIPGDTLAPDIWKSAWDLNHNGRYDGPNDPYVEGVPYRDLNNNGKYDPPNKNYDYGEPYTDSNGNGKWDSADGFWDYGYDQWALYSNQTSEVNTFTLDLTSQVSKQHEIKSGIEFKALTLKMGEIQYPDQSYDGQPDGGAWPDRGVFRDFYVRQPKQGSFYVRDKMEYGEMIADLGFRYEFYLQANEVKGTNYANQNLSGSNIYDSRNKFSPRISFSFPISDKAKLYFNYGHFYQLPDLVNFYRRPTQSSSAFGIVGNPNLDFTKQIQYELGVQYSIVEGYVLDLSGFYKDYYGLLNSIRQTYGPIATDVYGNVDYARSRGLEAKLEKRYGSFFAGSIEYQYAFAYGKNSAENSDYFARFYNNEIPIQERPLDWDIRHQLTVNSDIRAAKGQHPKFGIFTLPDDWSLNFIWQFKSGRPYTPDARYPGLVLAGREKPLSNSLRMSSYSNVDVRLDKNFQVWKLNYTFIVNVLNIFDSRNVSSLASGTGASPTGLPYSNQNNNGQILTGTAIDANPANYEAGRQIQVGLSLNF